MANRNDPDVRQHETLPGLCPAPGHSLSLPGGARPVEQMMDAAIARIESERGDRGAIERHYAERDAHEQRLARYDDDLAQGQPPSSKATRLRWKGLDVSEEFREYAERVARGEDLPPFEGRVLAEPNAAFPWGSLSRSETPALPAAASAARPGRGGQLALWTSAAVVTALLGWSVALKFQAIDPPRALIDVAASGADAPVVATSTAPEAARAPGEAEAMAAAVEQPPSASVQPALPADIAAPLSEPSAAAVAPAPTAVVPPSAATTAAAAEPPASAGAPSAAVAAGVAVSIAPTLAEPTAGSPPPVAAAPVAAPTAAPAPAPKPTASPRHDADFDFGIDELPLPSGSAAGAKGQVSETGNIGDLARVGQSGGGAARKEPGSESSAKGSLLVDKPSF